MTARVQRGKVSFLSMKLINKLKLDKHKEIELYAIVEIVELEKVTTRAERQAVRQLGQDSRGGVQKAEGGQGSQAFADS